ncbi:MFS transporter [Egibacter rhizosphaerae]|uniref:MFS transporter n=1 Tax=Egibacter rhizosphaerae TaxID=1670831 RepID=A0A411YCZ1_9ACTN|nr:MFS transporter [Egibacter rhizosphaerae]QBI19032.1 MFS transporter [Egibacter rhizosphaerae]
MNAPQRLARDVVAALAAVLLARLAINGGVRVVYPFLPEIARGLGVSLAVVSGLVALRSLVGIAAPAVARITESLGRRNVMLVGLGTAFVGALLVVAAPLAGESPLFGPLALAAAGFVAAGAAKPLFDVPMQGWFGARVPYAQRGRVLGITELTWALSLLATVPLAGVLIPRFGWQSAFVIVATLAVTGLLAVRLLLAPDRPKERSPRPLRLTSTRVRMLVVILAYSVAAELMFVVYGAWLEDDLGLSVTAIGVFTIVVVVSELVGEGGVVGFADRLGPRRTILLGLLVSGIAYASLGAVGGSLVAGVAVVVVWFVGFEVTITATIPLVSELAAESRDRLLSLMVSTIALARGIGALLGPPLYELGGIAASGLAAAALVAAAGALLTGVAEPARTRTPGRHSGSV